MAPDCPKWAKVAGGDDGQTGVLICTLPADHIGNRHFDSEDSIWWSKDGDSDGV